MAHNLDLKANPKPNHWPAAPEANWDWYGETPLSFSPLIPFPSVSSLSPSLYPPLPLEKVGPFYFS